jgi:uncharacterized protein YfdQ (DUF2303 family)
MALFENTETSNDAEAIISAVEKLSEHKVFDAERGTFNTASVAVVPEGKKLQSLKPFLDEYRTRPDRKTGRTRLTTLKAFAAFVNRHKTSDTIIFLDDVDRASPKLIAVFNAHPAETAAVVPPPLQDLARDLVEGESLAAFQDFSAEYLFPVSDEWKAWAKLPDSFSQAEFAEFLEDHVGDVIDPAAAGDRTKALAATLGVQIGSAARLMQLAKGLTIHVNAKSASVINLSTGEAAIQFSEEHTGEGGEQLRIPGAFGIRIPVFRQGESFQLPVRLRYRASSGRVTWMLVPHRIDETFDTAIDDAASKVIEATDCPLYRGRIEK